jgi:heme/copper-type cytochrome/quinol oxidase subunit 4
MAAPDPFASSGVSLFLSWLFCVPVFSGILGFILSPFSKQEGIPRLFSVWVALCFLVLSPMRYLLFLLVVGTCYPWQSVTAFASVMAWGRFAWLPLIFCLLFAICYQIPLLLTFLTLGAKTERTAKLRYAITAVLAPIFALVGSLVFSVVHPFAAFATHGLPAIDVIRATNGPAYYVFGWTVSPWQVALPRYVHWTPERTQDYLRVHVAYVYLNSEDQTAYVRAAYPEVYEALATADDGRP